MSTRNENGVLAKWESRC